MTINTHNYKMIYMKLSWFVYESSETVYAMKVYNKMTLYEKNVILNTISEKNILKNMNSNFIVKLHYAF